MLKDKYIKIKNMKFFLKKILINLEMNIIGDIFVFFNFEIKYNSFRKVFLRLSHLFESIFSLRKKV